MKNINKVNKINLTFVPASPAQDAVATQSDDKKHELRINVTQAISKSKDTLFLLFERPWQIVLQLIQQIHSLFMSATEPVRLSRKFKLNHKMNKRVHYFFIVRWGHAKTIKKKDEGETL